MRHERERYVNGGWVQPLQPTLLDVIDPSTEELFTRVTGGGPRDVDRSVAAARRAFPQFSATSPR
ncbi:MAG: aldehyde dehydrogenase family protein [Mesorhizobium sp.]|nr:MAG: aldehyde dehydrogenase family protein [Mesorhizobium sp.]TIP95009.1 MAG: aldehyde dehydrogenase family protein [Mesorhizobium sp.]